jgi:hypothetical protein
VNVSGEPQVGIGQVVELSGLVGFAWEQTRNGQTRWGIAYRAESVSASAAVGRAPRPAEVKDVAA